MISFMDLYRAVRCAFVVGLLLFSPLAAALEETYEGVLEPQNHDPKIPIIVKLKDIGISLEGSVTTSGSYKGRGVIDAGGSSLGQCSLHVVLSSTVVLRMSGHCDLVSFYGTYVLADGAKRVRQFGTFNLARRASDKLKTETGRTPMTTAACLKANTQCVLACPRTEESADFICSNRCRTKLNVCKERAKRNTAARVPEE